MNRSCDFRLFASLSVKFFCAIDKHATITSFSMNVPVVSFTRMYSKVSSSRRYLFSFLHFTLMPGRFNSDLTAISIEACFAKENGNNERITN